MEFQITLPELWSPVFWAFAGIVYVACSLAHIRILKFIHYKNLQFEKTHRPSNYESAVFVICVGSILWPIALVVYAIVGLFKLAFGKVDV